jgi:hypothetical protein
VLIASAARAFPVRVRAELQDRDGELVLGRYLLGVGERLIGERDRLLGARRGADTGQPVLGARDQLAAEAIDPREVLGPGPGGIGACRGEQFDAEVDADVCFAGALVLQQLERGVLEPVR